MNFTLNTVVYSYINRIASGASQWGAFGTGIASAISFLQGKVNLPGAKNDGSVKWKLTVPVTADEDTTCACTGEVMATFYGSFELSIPRNSSTSQRTDWYLRMKSLVNDPATQDSYVNFVQP